jgi:hypothetical protein
VSRAFTAIRSHSLAATGLRVFWLGLFGAVALLGAGCGRPKPYVPTLQAPRRVAVLDLAESQTVRTVPLKTESWWFFAYDLYRDENFGNVVADELAEALEEFPYLDLYSRLELKYYFAARREVLEGAFKKLGEYTDAQYEEMIDRIDLVKIGRDLGVDYVIAGRVEDACLARNRTIHWTWSFAEVVIEVHDTRTGKPIYRKTLRDRRVLATPNRLVRDAIQDILPELDEVFRRAQSATRVSAPKAAAPRKSDAAAKEVAAAPPMKAPRAEAPQKVASRGSKRR